MIDKNDLRKNSKTQNALYKILQVTLSTNKHVIGHDRKDKIKYRLFPLLTPKNQRITIAHTSRYHCLASQKRCVPK